MSFAKKQLFTAASLGASVASDPMRMGGASLFSAHVITTSAAALDGSFALEGSNDDGPTPTNWTLIGPTSGTGTTTQAVTGNGKILYNISDVAFEWVRITWTRVAGTGVVNAIANVKQGLP